MTGNPASVSVLALAGCLVCLGILATSGPVRAQSAPLPNDTAARQFPFDIPAQPLDDAIKAYGLVTGLSVLAASGALRQRTSTAVHGTYTPEEALRRILSGTGLQARFPEVNAAAIYQPSGAAPADVALPNDAAVELAAIDGVRAGGADYRPYVGAVQARLVRALCQSVQARPGNYRLAVQLRIAASGAVAAVRQSGSTGDAARDAVLARTLRNLTFDPPPAAMPQPVTILLRPDGAGVATACPAASLERG